MKLIDGSSLSKVGLSPKGRAKAIELVSAKQRDMQADPRIRIAACWLALELGSADLTALDESLRYLGDSNHKATTELIEFAQFAVSRTDRRQTVAVTRRWETFITLLESSSDYFALEIVGKALVELAPHLEPKMVNAAWVRSVTVLNEADERRERDWILQTRCGREWPGCVGTPVGTASGFTRC